MKRKIIFLLMLSALLPTAHAQVSLNNLAKGTFALSTPKQSATIIYDSKDALVVERCARLLSEDVKRVTGRALPMADVRNDAKADNAIIIGTLGQSKCIDRLVSEGRIDTTSLTGAWERYRIQIVKHPLPGIKQAIVIAGSDRRGTAFGTLSVSKAIGVNPWYWWMDTPIHHRESIQLNIKNFTSKSPSVKYRGIFINDEDWGLLPWAKHNYEKELGNIGPKTYARVCELLLRLNANHLAPAMHECSTAFHKNEANRLVADTFAIVMGSSHCEPLLLNTASEWDRGKYGQWDYVHNRHGVDSVLNARAQVLAPYENVYTLALRGLHDVAMAGGNDINERRNTMQQALMAQREMIAKATGKPAESIPQSFTPYKEVLDVYDRGLKLPDDVTIIWPDDNYGYMKRLPSPEEQKRSGRSGVYYHASYLGRPHDHLWMNTQSPTHMYLELKKAYDLTADRIWLLNAGDIKSCEFAMDLFLNMAYDLESFNLQRVADYRAEWTCNLLDDYTNFPLYNDIFHTFYDLSFQRRPESMGWGQEWSTDDRNREQCTDTEFSLRNYDELMTRMARFKDIQDKVSMLHYGLDSLKYSCFYQAVAYPVIASALMNSIHMTAQVIRDEASRNSAFANDDMVQMLKTLYRTLQLTTEEYNNLENGKWKGIMSLHQGVTASYYDMPSVSTSTLSEQAVLGVLAEGNEDLHGPRSRQQLPTFSRYYPEKQYSIEVYNKGKEPLEWQLLASEPWIVTDKSEGITEARHIINISVDWTKAPVSEGLTASVVIKSKDGTQQEEVLVNAFNPASPSIEELKGCHVEDNGYVSIPAAGFARKQDSKDVSMITVPNLGCEGTAIMMGDPTAPRQNIRSTNAPYLEYEFYTWERGMVDVYTYVMPTFTTSVERGFAGHEQTMIENQYGVRIDDGLMAYHATNSWEYAQQWYESVQKNTRVNKSTLYIKNPGKHTLRIICSDPGVIVQKMVIDFGGMRRSYMGPPAMQAR